MTTRRRTSRAAKSETRPRAKTKPRSVPKEAEYFPDWDEWGVGQKVDGKMEGDWKLWRGDGQYVEESPWKNGKCHGEKKRFHDDGSLSSIANYVDGVQVRIQLWRTKKKTREPNFEGMPKNIHAIDFLYTNDGWQNCQRFHTKDGKEVELNGKPVPPHPASVPELAYFNAADGHWLAGEWRLHEGKSERRRVYRFWEPNGALLRIEYYEAGQFEDDNAAETAIFDARPDWGCVSNPLIHAAKAKDDEAVAICWDAGLGQSPGAAMHAAHEGLYDLALRISSAPKSEPVLADPRGSSAARRGPIPAEAMYVAGLDRWIVGAFDAGGRPQGTWKLWWAPEDHTFVKAGQIDFIDGAKRAFREYDRNGAVEEEKTWDENGRLIRERKTEYGVTEETEHRADGSIALQRFHHESTALQAARVVKDGKLVVEAWFDREGTQRAEVIPAPPQWLKKLRPSKHHDDDDEEDSAPPELWTSGDVQGLVGAGLDGHALGMWTVGKAKADFSVVHLHKEEGLADVAATLARWQKKKPKPDKIPWRKLETFFDDGTNFPFYLQGIESGEPGAVAIAIQHLRDPVLHQSTISEIAGPTFRAVAKSIESITHAEALVDVLGFMTAIATREGDIDAANQNKRLYVAKPKAGGKLFGKNDVEPAYFDVCDAITRGVSTWIRLAAHDDPRVRDEAIILLAIAHDPKAEAALIDRLAKETDVPIRAHALLALGLHAPARELLEPFLSDDDPMLRVAAALTWVRTHIEPYDPAAGVLLECLTGAIDPSDWRELYLGTGNAKSEAAATLTLLPPKQSAAHLERMCGAIETPDGKSAVALADALLQLAFGTSEWVEGEKLSPAQHTVLSVIASSDAAWTFDVNLGEILQEHDLPGDRPALRALLGGTKAPAKPTTRILTAFGGPSGGVHSFVKTAKKKR